MERQVRLTANSCLCAGEHRRTDPLHGTDLRVPRRNTSQDKASSCRGNNGMVGAVRPKFDFYIVLGAETVFIGLVKALDGRLFVVV